MHINVFSLLLYAPGRKPQLLAFCTSSFSHIGREV